MQYHSYIFLTSSQSIHTIRGATLRRYKKEFTRELKKIKGVMCNTYATLGFKANTHILLWLQAEKVDTIQDAINTLLHTNLGKHLTISYTLFGMTRPTQYSAAATGHLDTSRKGDGYLIIYPFTKTQQWYMLDFDTRRKLMGGHVAIGKKHDKITQQLLYSYGVDDNEFIVSYETSDLSAFQTLVMELRSDKVREYTRKDTPIFTCVYKTPEDVVNYL